MGKVLVSEAAFAGFRFVRANPKIVAAWAGLFLAVALFVGGVFVATAGPQLTAMMALGPHPDPQEMMPIFAKLAPFYALAMLFACVFYPTLYAAMSRALLRPADDRFAYLRLSGAELNQFVLFLLFTLMLTGLYIGFIIAELLLAFGFGAALGKTAGVLAAFAGFLAGFCGFVFVSIRLSLASPLTFDKGRLDLFGSWALTRGRFWSLFGCYLLVACVMMVFGLLILVIFFAIAMVMGGLVGVTGLMRPDMTSLAAYFSPMRLVLTVLGAGIYAAFWPVVLMPPVNAYMQIVKRDEVTSP